MLLLHVLFFLFCLLLLSLLIRQKVTTKHEALIILRTSPHHLPPALISVSVHCCVAASPSHCCSFIAVLVLWERARHPVGLSKTYAQTASVRRLCEAWHSPAVGGSPRMSRWSLLRCSEGCSRGWGGFFLMTVTQIWDLFCQQEVPAWCCTRQKSPVCFLLFFLSSFHLVSHLSLSSLYPRLPSLPPSHTPRLIICVTVFRLIGSTSWAWHK